MELGDGGQEAVRLALVRVVCWLQTVGQEQHKSAILTTTTSAVRKHDRMTVIRCYAESGSGIARYFRERIVRIIIRSDPTLIRSDCSRSCLHTHLHGAAQGQEQGMIKLEVLVKKTIKA